MISSVNKDYIITDAVFTRTKTLLSQDKTGAIALRVSVEGGGCSGFKYKYELVRQIAADDIVIEQNGIQVVFDKVSAPFLQNATIDYVEDLGSAHFQVTNPNAVAKCGCGSSFSV